MQISLRIKNLLLLAIVGFCSILLSNSFQIHSFSNHPLKPTEIHPPKELRIGIMAASVHLYVLKKSGALEKRLQPQGVSVKWVEFSSGVPLVQAMGKNEIDLGYTGGIPALIGQAQDIPLVYIAITNKPPTPTFTGFLVHKDSPIKTIADLKGKKVATTKASIAYYLLFQGLRENRLSLEDIQLVDMTPLEGQAAFRKGEVDAWVGWHPYLAQLQESMSTRLLASGNGLINDRTYYLATRSFVEKHFDLIPIAIQEMKKAGIWTNNHQQQAAEIMALTLKWEKRIALTTIASHSNEVATQQIQDRAIEEQQRMADTFFRVGLLPKQIIVEDAVWKGKLSN
jgi:sulfonate transport system substrate-binding protein